MRYCQSARVACRVVVLGAIMLLPAACDDPVGPNARVAHVEKLTDVPERFAFGSAPVLNPAVLVTDADGQPVRGAEVYFRAYGGGVGDGVEVTVTTGRDGIAVAPGWTPFYIGENILEARAAGFAVAFSTTGFCAPSRALALGDRVTGRLDADDCKVSTEGCNYFCHGSYHERFSFTLPAQRSVKVELSGGGIDPVFDVALHDAADRKLAMATYHHLGGSWSFFWVILPAGSYELELRDWFGGSDVDYTLDIDPGGEDLGCNVSYVTRDVTTSQQLGNLDCMRRASDRFDDQFLLMLPDGESATVTMAAGQFAPLLQIEHVVYRDDPDRISIVTAEGAAGVPLSLERTCATEHGCLFRVSATSASPSVRGTYTLSVR